MRSYLAFGLGIHSEIPLPELTEAERGADIVIKLGTVPRPPGLDPSNDDYSRIADDTVEFHTPLGGFRLSGAHEVLVEPSPHVNPSTLRLVLLGRVIGALLQWRGHFVLHASAVARDGHAIAFAGESGAGKSTTAATFLSRGFELVADDIVAIDLASSVPQVLPGFAQMKLWPDAALAQGISHEHLERVHPDHEKRILSVESHQLVPDPQKLDAIYLLEDGANTAIREIDLQDALVGLLRASYAPRIMRALGSQGAHFEQAAQIADRVATQSLSIAKNRRQPFDAFDVIAATHPWV